MESCGRPGAFGLFLALFQARPWVTDVLLAFLVLVIGALSRPTMSFTTPAQAVYTLVVLVCAAALLIRRRRPLLSLAIIGLFLLIHLVFVREPGVFAAAVCVIAAYTTQTQLDPPWCWRAATVIYLGACAAVLSASGLMGWTTWSTRLTVAGGVIVVLTLATLAGVIRRDRKIRYEDALDRAAALEARREMERRLAAVQERTRIAWEMHDVLGHSLNVIAVQAEGVRYVARTDPEKADQVLADIGKLSRSAVDDVRALIDVLTTDEAQDTPRPTPSLQDIPMLIDDLRHTTAPIRLLVDGDLTQVPATVGLAGYRIVPEALTNILKHADGAAATIHIRVDATQVDISILNTAARGAGTGEPAGRQHGIVGMHQRARALGGMLWAGPDPHTGGWRVRANLPWSDS